MTIARDKFSEVNNHISLSVSTMTIINLLCVVNKFKFNSNCMIFFFLQDVNELLLYFAIAGGVTAGALLLLFILVFVLFVKVNRLSTDG